MGSPNKKKLILRCVVYPGTNEGKKGYYAICIDVNLFTWRPTLKEATHSLNDAIVGYLDTVADLTQEEKVKVQILRPAPFWPHKARYYLYSLLDRVLKDDHTTYEEPVSLPLGAAA